jgi:hypothetical protein
MKDKSAGYRNLRAVTPDLPLSISQFLSVLNLYCRRAECRVAMKSALNGGFNNSAEERLLRGRKRSEFGQA